LGLQQVVHRVGKSGQQYLKQAASARLGESIPVPAAARVARASVSFRSFLIERLLSGRTSTSYKRVPRLQDAQSQGSPQHKKHPPEGQQTRVQDAAAALLGENRPAAAPVRPRARVRNRIFLRIGLLLSVYASTQEGAPGNRQGDESGLSIAS
jgi:hypothetical protein